MQEPRKGKQKNRRGEWKGHSGEGKETPLHSLAQLLCFSCMAKTKQIWLLCRVQKGPYHVHKFRPAFLQICQLFCWWSWIWLGPLSSTFLLNSKSINKTNFGHRNNNKKSSNYTAIYCIQNLLHKLILAWHYVQVLLRYPEGWRENFQTQFLKL